MGKKIEITPEVHRQAAIHAFNETWELIEKRDRTDIESFAMEDAAHASLYHWRKVGTPLNVQRGEWLIARVCSILGSAEEARKHALACWKVTEQNAIAGFDRAFAHEAVARAAACGGDRELFALEFDAALDAGTRIEEQEDRDHFFEDLYGGPWYGMTLRALPESS